MKNTVKSSSEIDQIFQTARRAAHPLLVALVSPTPTGRDPRGRVVFIAGRKIGNAVARNRAKRVLRDAVRRASGPWSGWDVALIARGSVLKAKPAQVDEAMASCLHRAEVTR